MSPSNVTAIDGTDVQVVTLADLLAQERGFRNWLVGIFGTILGVAVTLGVLYGTMRADLGILARRVEEIRVEGSTPVHAIQTDLTLFRERQDQNTMNIAKMTVAVAENAEALARIEAYFRIPKPK
jgi:hypothetical protein